MNNVLKFASQFAKLCTADEHRPLSHTVPKGHHSSEYMLARQCVQLVSVLINKGPNIHGFGFDRLYEIFDQINHPVVARLKYLVQKYQHIISNSPNDPILQNLIDDIDSAKIDIIRLQ